MPRRFAGVLFSLAPWLSIGACIQEQRPSVNRATEAVRVANAQAVAALQSHDVEAALRFYTEDAVVQLPGMAAVRGRAALRALYSGRANPDVTLEAEPELIRVAASGDVAYLIGRKREVCRQTGAALSEGKVLSTWEEQGGHWLITALSASDNAAERGRCP